MKLHIVKEGDTLERLAEAYGVPAEQLRAANPDVAEGELTRGFKVKIPFAPIKALAAKKAKAAKEAGQANEAAESSADMANESAEAPAGDGEKSAEEAAQADETEAVKASEENIAAAKSPAKQADGPWTWSSFVKRNEQSAPAESAEPQQTAQPQPQPPMQPVQPQQQMNVQPQPQPPMQPVQPQQQMNLQPQPLQMAPTNSQPTFYKTEWGTSSDSPLHAQWSGMQEFPAVPPYAALPTPVIPMAADWGAMPNALNMASAPASANDGMTLPPLPYAQNAAPNAAMYMHNAAPNAPMYAQNAAAMPELIGKDGTFAAMQTAGYPVMGLPGYDPAQGMPQGMPYGAYAQGFPVDMTPPVPLPTPIPPVLPHDCGCWGAAPKAPYAMPLQDDPSVMKKKARSSSTENSAAETGEQENRNEGKEAAKRASTAKKKARIAAKRDPLERILKAAAAKRRIKTRRYSRPWIND